jgi:hypothetical protein
MLKYEGNAGPAPESVQVLHSLPINIMYCYLPVTGTCFINKKTVVNYIRFKLRPQSNGQEIRSGSPKMTISHFEGAGVGPISLICITVRGS